LEKSENRKRKPESTSKRNLENLSKEPNQPSRCGIRDIRTFFEVLPKNNNPAKQAKRTETASKVIVIDYFTVLYICTISKKKVPHFYRW